MIQIREVTTKKDLKAFVHFPNALYEGNPHYVPQIESMERDTLMPAKNHAFEVCEAKYWLAYDEGNRIVGRVAGIGNRKYNEKTGERICRFGFIDFTDNQEVSKTLMDTVERYAKEKGMATMCGPMGFLEFDTAGVLVEGFDQLPTAYGKYNAPYYERHLTRLGYVKDVDFVVTIIESHHRCGDRDATLFFDFHPVAGSSFFDFIAFNRSSHMDCSTEEEQFLG